MTELIISDEPEATNDAPDTGVGVNERDIGLAQQDLLKIANMKMPFGRFAGRSLIELPEEYLLWFQKREFPTGELGRLMELTLAIKIEGLESLIYPLRQSPSAAGVRK